MTAEGALLITTALNMNGENIKDLTSLWYTFHNYSHPISEFLLQFHSMRIFLYLILYLKSSPLRKKSPPE